MWEDTLDGTQLLVVSDDRWGSNRTRASFFDEKNTKKVFRERLSHKGRTYIGHEVTYLSFSNFNKRPMDLVVPLENQLGHLPKFYMYSLSIPWVEIQLIFTLGTAVSQIRADFQNCHIWA